ncbi:hypothetical protein N5079_15560 [Planotetraspora sp. A-T 1434]|uniref:hypothetical protein n=1 Tax=Planotetraspora sp. A-T 1434 TaxID=2979219 RepID=UPI0021BEEE01|nr:hypothetical protein [Planotetraspora sp. A-T 1434]MCT9931631.1 hypothetical protein [Planotetraspora sp. A-T 1434]
MAERLAKAHYSPALFDLARDITGGLPIKLVELWIESEQSSDAALRLLKEHKVLGYTVVSDSAGLTRLTRQKGLMEILALIDRPKQIVYGHGTAIGGEGVGIWAADNTQMLYPPSTGADVLLSSLLTVQDEIARRCRVQIGLGAHFGEFYRLAGGLYGGEANAIEEITENDTEAGEILVSQTVVDQLPDGHTFTLTRKDGEHPAIGAMYRVLDGPRLNDVQPVGGHYPIPYSEVFYTGLVAYAERLDDAAAFGRRLADRHLRDSTVVLVEHHAHPAHAAQPAHRAHPAHAARPARDHEASLLNELALSALMKDTGLRHLPEDGASEVKVSGRLGIYLFDDPTAAVGFARKVRGDLEERQITCRIGIDAGPVLVSGLPGGGTDIAGMPVNIASKMAQDMGRPGRIYLSEALREHADPAHFSPVHFTVSGVQMTAFEG